MLSAITFLQVRVREAASQETAAGIVEYLLLVLFIALVLVLALGFFSGQLGSAFSRAGNSIPS